MSRTFNRSEIEHRNTHPRAALLLGACIMTGGVLIRRRWSSIYLTYRKWRKWDCVSVQHDRINSRINWLTVVYIFHVSTVPSLSTSPVAFSYSDRKFRNQIFDPRIESRWKLRHFSLRDFAKIDLSADKSRRQFWFRGRDTMLECNGMVYEF